MILVYNIKNSFGATQKFQDKK